jgi:epoxyqueuosine reductase
MGYLAAEAAVSKRHDPRLVLPECCSILVLALRYPDPSSISFGSTSGASPSGRVAAYAWGEDYHLVLPSRLQALVDFVGATVGHPFPYRFYTDTGPLLERELAQRAGLGWIGKNTCLIDPRRGSYFLLAEILLGLELEPDPPFTADRCGKCTRCIRACPTGCILPDRTIDARRCISYLTIENKDSIDPDLRTRMGSWVFGCDICQVVCPWNRFSAPQYEPAFAPWPGVPEPDLVAELGLSSQEFNQKYGRSPLQRARRNRYQRNVAVALGNSGSPSALSVLESASRSENPLLQEHALWAIAQILK